MSSKAAIYRGMSQVELNRQYDQRTLVAEYDALFAKWRSASAAAAERLGQPTRMAYGDGAHHYVDFYGAKGPVRGVHVHFHGGAWKALGSSDCWWLAEPWIDAGYHFAAANFSLVPTVCLATQIDEARDVLERLPALLESVKWDLGAGELVISGHSSGAHLAALTMLASSRASLDLAPEQCCLVLASGIYDLEPVRLSSRNSYLGLTRDEALRFSPLHQVRPSNARVIVLWSRNELAEFQRQSRDFVERLESLGVAVQARPIEAATHFDTWDEILPDLLASEPNDTASPSERKPAPAPMVAYASSLGTRSVEK